MRGAREGCVNVAAWRYCKIAEFNSAREALSPRLASYCTSFSTPSPKEVFCMRAVNTPAPKKV